MHRKEGEDQNASHCFTIDLIDSPYTKAFCDLCNSDNQDVGMKKLTKGFVGTTLLSSAGLYQTQIESKRLPEKIEIPENSLKQLSEMTLSDDEIDVLVHIESPIMHISMIACYKVEAVPG